MVKYILILCMIFFAQAAFACEEASCSFPLENNRTLTIVEKEHYNWAEGYALEIRPADNATAPTEPLVVDVYDSDTKKIKVSDDNIIQSSGLPEFKNGKLTASGRIGPDAACEEEYKLESSVQTHSSHLIMLRKNCYTIPDDDNGKHKTISNYVRK